MRAAWVTAAGALLLSGCMTPIAERVPSSADSPRVTSESSTAGPDSPTPEDLARDDTVLALVRQAEATWRLSADQRDREVDRLRIASSDARGSLATVELALVLGMEASSGDAQREAMQVLREFLDSGDRAGAGVGPFAGLLLDLLERNHVERSEHLRTRSALARLEQKLARLEQQIEALKAIEQTLDATDPAATTTTPIP